MGNRLKTALLVLGLAVLFLSLPVACSGSLSEREVLAALYRATNGPDWSNNDGWLTEEPLGEWHGVVVDGDGRVIERRLAKNQLSGEIPPELGDLRNLWRLDLSQNPWSGCVPGSLRDIRSVSLPSLPFCP